MALNVLVVDDNIENIDSLIDSISNSKTEFTRALSGKAALNTLVNRNFDFDLAFITAELSEIDGFELAEKLRSIERGNPLPLIFVTGQSRSPHLEYKASQLGAIDFVFRPIDVGMLRAKIDLFQRLKAKRLRLNEQVRELEIAKRKFEEWEQRAVSADRLKSAFLANMSHEIRTPITAVMGFAEMLRPLTFTDPRAKQFVEIIHRNSVHLLDLVNGILDLSKVETGQLDVEKINVDLNQAIHEVVQVLQPIAKQNNVRLRFAKTTAHCDSDPMRLKQILTNVIGNAVKFSPGGHVEISVESDAEQTMAKVYVKDSGIGIAEDQRNLLFKPFSQLHSGKFHGTGLGLSLSKKLATLMGGEISLEESVPDAGSTFLVQLPMASSNSVTAETLSMDREDYPADCLAGMKILLADDSSDNRMLVEAALSEYGAEVQTVENGQKALDQVDKMNPNVLLLDFKMPVLDGLSAARMLRSRGDRRPIILLTANAMKGERESILNAGATDYVSKPIDWQELIGKIIRSAGHSYTH